MAIWKSYDQFSEAFLGENREFLLNDILHQVISFIIFPSLENDYAQRKQITLSLNLSTVQQLEIQGRKSEAARALVQMPTDFYFKENWNQAYPLWLLEKEWSEREVKNHFIILGRLVWTLLRLGATYQACWGERRASLNETIEVIVGSTPVKSQKSTDYLCGEKAYASHFKHYKPVCHFIAAFEYMKSEDSRLSSLLHLSRASQIERFLSLSESFRRELILLSTPNVKNNAFLSDELLIKVPLHVRSAKITLPIQPISEKVNELNQRVVSS